MSPLHARAYARFKEAFGEPDNVIVGDRHWSIRRGELSHYMVSINVLLNTAGDHPVVWVFDPYDRKTGITHVAIRDEDHIEETINAIEARVERAAEISGSGPSAEQRKGYE